MATTIRTLSSFQRVSIYGNDLDGRNEGDDCECILVCQNTRVASVVLMVVIAQQDKDYVISHLPILASSISLPLLAASATAIHLRLK